MCALVFVPRFTRLENTQHYYRGRNKLYIVELYLEIGNHYKYELVSDRIKDRLYLTKTIELCSMYLIDKRMLRTRHIGMDKILV